MEPRRLVVAALATIAFSLGCGGDLNTSEDRASEADAAKTPAPGHDAGHDASLKPDATTPPDASDRSDTHRDPDPCDLVACAPGASCREGVCACPENFTGDPTVACVAPEPDDPSARSEREVCERYERDYETRSSSLYDREPKNACDPGTLHPETRDDAIRRTNLMRWLAGLEPVGWGEEYAQKTQECSVVLAAEKKLTHSIKPEMECYTEGAKQAAGSSNLSAGARSAADAVDAFMRDTGVPSLGHRRWILHHKMGKTGFGRTGRYTCMWSFDSSSSAKTPDFVAWPSPGPFPAQLARLATTWSFHSKRYKFTDKTRVRAELLDGTPLEVSNTYRPKGNYGKTPALAWHIKDSGPLSDESLRVTIEGLERDKAPASVSYTVRFTPCADP